MNKYIYLFMAIVILALGLIFGGPYAFLFMLPAIALIFILTNYLGRLFFPANDIRSFGFRVFTTIILTIIFLITFFVIVYYLASII